MARLCEAWLQMREDTFERAMAVLARSLARVAGARQRIEDNGGLTDAVKRLVGRLGPLFGGSANSNDPVEQARAALAARLDDDVRASTAELLALHGLEGKRKARSWRVWPRSSRCANVSMKARPPCSVACSAARWPG